MAEKTGIAWTDSTVNFWWGCTKVTSACDHCYAEDWAGRMRKMKWGSGAERVLIKSAPGLLRKIDRQAKKENRTAKVFMHSMSDIFDQEVPDEWRERVFDSWRATSNVWIQALTKRPAMVKRYSYPAERVWLGTSLGSDADLPLAYKIVEAPASLHWISYEPAIGSLSIDKLPKEIKWVVVGGESGKGARPFDLQWAFDTVSQCRARGIACFVKQLGAVPVIGEGIYPTSDSHGKILSEWPEALRVQEFPI